MGAMVFSGPPEKAMQNTPIARGLSDYAKKTTAPAIGSYEPGGASIRYCERAIISACATHSESASRACEDCPQMRHN